MTPLLCDVTIAFSDGTSETWMNVTDIDDGGETLDFYSQGDAVSVNKSFIKWTQTHIVPQDKSKGE